MCVFVAPCVPPGGAGTHDCGAEAAAGEEEGGLGHQQSGQTTVRGQHSDFSQLFPATELSARALPVLPRPFCSVVDLKEDSVLG